MVVSWELDSQRHKMTIVSALAVSGSDVYVGGEFTQAGGQSANYMAMWNGSALVFSWDRSSQWHRLTCACTLPSAGTMYMWVVTSDGGWGEC